MVELQTFNLLVASSILAAPTKTEKEEKMKLYLDDERHPPEGWDRVSTPEEVIELLETKLVTHLSLDHDLGLDDDRTGYHVLLWLEEKVIVEGFRPPKISIHSANSGARKKMEQALNNIQECT